MHHVTKIKIMNTKHFLPVCLALTMVAPVAGAATRNSYRVSAFDNMFPGTDISASDFSATGPVSFSATRVAASADFGVLKARASASSSTGVDPFHNESTASSADTSFRMFVNATPPAGGGQGLQFGDTVSLNLSFKLTGSLFASSSGGTGSASARADLRIEDPNICPEGCIRLFDFNANTGVNSGSGNTWLWNLTTWDVNEVIIDSQSDRGNGTASSLSFSTGILTTTIQTTIGAELDIIGSLDVQSVATWGAAGSADFFDTFGLVVAPVTEGVELGFDTYLAPFDLGGAAVVPVPAAVWLFGSGLIGLIGLAGRKRCSVTE